MNKIDIELQAEVAIRAKARLAELDLGVTYVMLAVDYDDPEHGPSVDIQVEIRTLTGKYLLDEGREAKVNEFLEIHRDAVVTREGTYGKPDMLVSWYDSGVRVEVNFGSGVCEQRQVGTKVVETYDPEQLAALTKITVEEPVYEYFCPDPILN
jgi:hypothetical protein